MNSKMNKQNCIVPQAAATMKICAQQKMQIGIFKGTAEHFVRLIQFTVFVLLWKAFADAKVDMGGFTLQQLLTYTLLSFVLRQQLDIVSPATAMIWEGSIVGRYTRPMPLIVSFVAETVGKYWIPYCCYSSVPLLLIGAFLGISPISASFLHFLLFFLSLILSIILGFAIDLLFAAFAIRLKNGMFMATRIREAVYSLLSGALIPFSLFPKWAQVVLFASPFGSVASAPLNIYVGKGNVAAMLALQLFWVITITLAAQWAYHKSEESMVSYGG